MMRLDNLVTRVRAHVGRSKDVTRTALARTLLRKGIDLAQTRELKLDNLEDEETERIEYKVSPGEFERLTNLQKTYQSEFPGTALPALASLQRAVIRLAIPEAEIQATFPAFAEDVLLSRLKRGSRGRR
ncbi:MAG: hypothetical protein ACMG6S_09970 [Byssovorax sp.]